MCVCLWTVFFPLFVLVVHDFSACKQNAIYCFVAAAAATTVAIPATERMLIVRENANKLEKVLCETTEIAMQLFG